MVLLLVVVSGFTNIVCGKPGTKLPGFLFLFTSLLLYKVMEHIPIETIRSYLFDACLEVYALEPGSMTPNEFVTVFLQMVTRELKPHATSRRELGNWLKCANSYAECVSAHFKNVPTPLPSVESSHLKGNEC
jgi:hypothetical protein